MKYSSLAALTLYFLWYRTLLDGMETLSAEVSPLEEAIRPSVDTEPKVVAIVLFSLNKKIINNNQHSISMSKKIGQTVVTSLISAHCELKFLTSYNISHSSSN